MCHDQEACQCLETGRYLSPPAQGLLGLDWQHLVKHSAKVNWQLLQKYRMNLDKFLSR